MNGEVNGTVYRMSNDAKQAAILSTQTNDDGCELTHLNSKHAMKMSSSRLKKWIKS